MSLIFVDTDNSKAGNKLFSAAKAGKAIAAAEEKMQKVVKKIIDKTPGFTTAPFDNATGYSLRLEVTKVEVANFKTVCSLSGSIVLYPPKATAKRGEGEEVISFAMKGNATATGTNDRSMLDCIEAVAEDLVPKAIPVMRADFLKRNS